MTNASGTPILVSDSESTPLEPARDMTERRLQELIYTHPKCLPMDQIEPGLGDLVSVCMELPLRVGPVDNLLITPEGNLVMVEVKLWGNPEARRKVVAQALDYATALFKLDYVELEAAVKRADFNGAEHPERLYSLVDGMDAPPENVFADRVSHNLRDGRIVVLIVGDEIRPAADELVATLQAHANFHFTFALVEMPVYVLIRPDAANEYVVTPRMLVQTVEVLRFTIRTEGDSTVVVDAGTDEREAKKPSRRSTISSEEFFEEIRERSPDIPEKLRQFLDDVAAIDVYADFLKALNLKWDPPEGRRVTLAWIGTSGEIGTDCYAQVGRDAKAPNGCSPRRDPSAHRGRRGSVFGLGTSHQGFPERRTSTSGGVRAMITGFRSSFRDWAAEETDHPREVIEAALAHVVQNKGRGGLLPLADAGGEVVVEVDRVVDAGRPQGVALQDWDPSVFETRA